MIPSVPSGDAAFRVADRIRAPEPWEVFAERIRRYEIHLNGSVVELTRGPIVTEGYGIRLLRSREGKTATGFQASTDFSDEGIRTVVEDAEAVARHSIFPAKDPTLPSSSPTTAAHPEIVDPVLWSQPMETLEAFVHALTSPFDGRKNEVLSFGSVRASLIETSLANSSGLRGAYEHTMVEFEAAVKAFGGPEGPPPGEYWVNELARWLDPEGIPSEVAKWCQYAQDVRRAGRPPTGQLPVVLPTNVLATILPIVFGARFTGAARLREIAPPIGSKVSSPVVTVHDDGLYPWGCFSSPLDDEGTSQRGRTLIEAGEVSELLYDSLHASALSASPTGNAIRIPEFGGLRESRRFTHPPGEAVTTLVIPPGSGGTDAELIQAAGDGIWVQQLGWAFPDPISGAFGGEIRIGYRIRGGKLAEPVRGGTVGGVVMAPPGSPSLLADTIAVGSTTDVAEQLASPPLLVRPLVVAGD